MCNFGVDNSGISCLFHSMILKFFYVFLPDMPKSYMFRMVSMRFTEGKKEKPLPEDSNVVQRLSKNDLSRLKNSHSSFKYGKCLHIFFDTSHIKVG